MNPPPDDAAYFPDGSPSYETLLTDAHPIIAAFGGMFLLMLFLNWLFEEREHTWLTWLEKPLAKAGRLDAMAILVACVILLVVSETLAEDAETVLFVGAAAAWSSTWRSTGWARCSRTPVTTTSPSTSKHPDEAPHRPPTRPRPERRDPAGQGDRQGRLLPVPLPGGAGRVVLLRRRHRRVRHHVRPDHHRAGPRPDRRDVRPVADRLPGPQGHAVRVRVPRARRALGDRRPRRHPDGLHRRAHQRVHHRPARRRLHRRRLVQQHPTQQADRGPRARKSAPSTPDRRPSTTPEGGAVHDGHSTTVRRRRRTRRARSAGPSDPR